MSTTRDHIIDILRGEGFDARAELVADRILRTMPYRTLAEIRQESVRDATRWCESTSGGGLDYMLSVAERIAVFAETGRVEPLPSHPVSGTAETPQQH